MSVVEQTDLRELWRRRAALEARVKKKTLRDATIEEGLRQFAALCRAYGPLMDKGEGLSRPRRLQEKIAFQTRFLKIAEAERQSRRGHAV